MRHLQSFTPLVFSSLLLIFIVFQFQPPKSWVEATPSQWLLFYFPLLLVLISLANLYFKFWLRSLVAGIGLTILVILLGLKTLSLASGILTVAATILIVRSFKKPGSLRKMTKFPRLTKLKRQ